MRSLLLFTILVFNNYLHAQVVDVDAFEKGIHGSDVQILDVRTQSEYKSGHLTESLQADWTKKEEFIARTQYLDKQKPLYVYCLSGGRSAAAAKWLRENGYKKVVEMDGGFRAWKEAGKPVEGNAATKEMSLADFENKAKATPWVLVDVGAEWCPPCKNMKPVIHQFLTEHPSVTLLKVDGGNDKAVMNKLKAHTLPTFILLRNGKEIWRKQGTTTIDELSKALTPE